MQPIRPLLAFRGFICKSCLLRLQITRPISKLQRPTTSVDSPLKSKARSRRAYTTKLAQRQSPLQQGPDTTRPDKIFDENQVKVLEEEEADEEEEDYGTFAEDEEGDILGVVDSEIRELRDDLRKRRKSPGKVDDEAITEEEAQVDNELEKLLEDTGGLEKELGKDELGGVTDKDISTVKNFLQELEEGLIGDRIPEEMDPDEPEFKAKLEALQKTIQEAESKDGTISKEVKSMIIDGLFDLAPGGISGETDPLEKSEKSMSTTELQTLLSDLEKARTTEEVDQKPNDQHVHQLLSTLERGNEVAQEHKQAPLSQSLPSSIPAHIAEGTKSTTHESWIIPSKKFRGCEKYIRKLNKCIDTALKHVNEKSPKGIALKNERASEVFRWYILSRQRLLLTPQEIPPQSWTVLWEVLCSPIQADRLARINYLGSDMIQAGVPLQDYQRLLYIEAKFIYGDKHEAIKEWEASKAPLSLNKGFMKDKWELGVRMYSQNNEVQSALQAAEGLFRDVEDSANFRILIPIIRGCLAVQSRSTSKSTLVQMAWSIYIRMRLLAGSQMEMEDYDAVAFAFLRAERPELALGVFKDMMLAGDKSGNALNSTALFQESLDVEHDLTSLKIDEREMAWEQSEALAKLPTKYNNKYFFGSWIKKLIGDEELDFAGQVIDLMQDRGIRPDATYVNGLVGAWLRLGTQQGQELGETMAWKMIASRIEFVQTRKQARGKSLEAPTRAVFSSDRLGHKSPLVKPQATIETFSILVENYRRRQKHDLLTEVYDALGKAEVRPNTFFMNQVLMSDVRAHRKEWAWDLYDHLVRHLKLRPDFDTYNALWTIGSHVWNPVKTRQQHRGGFPECRSLFSEMATRASSLIEKEEHSTNLYDLVIRSFGIADDQAGTAVALLAFHRHFGKLPSDETVGNIVIQLGRVGQQNVVGLRPRRLNLNNKAKDRLSKVKKILETYKDQRVEALSQQGIDFDSLDEKAKAEEALMMLLDLLRHVAQARIDQMGMQDNSFRAVSSATELGNIAAKEMGVPDCIPW